MTAPTGWMGDSEPGPGMPITARLMDSQDRRAGVVETSLARSRGAEAREARDEAATAPDPDEIAAAMINRGYMPGATADLSQRLGDCLADLEAERAKIEKGERRQEIAMREHAAGRLGALEAARMLDGDQGDAHRAEQLERRAEGLRRQLGEAQAMISPPQERVTDAVEAASRRAHRTFTELTRAKMTEAQAGAPRSEPRPFASVSRGAAGTEHTGPDCQICAEGRRRDAARAVGTTASCSGCGYVDCRCGVAGAYVPVPAGTRLAVYR